MSIKSDIGFRCYELLFSGDFFKLLDLYGFSFALLSLEFLNGDV